jgi:hypothetical protein
VFPSFWYTHVYLDEDAQCFRVNTRVESSLWVLLTAAIILGFTNHFISKAACQQERDDNTKTNEDFLDKESLKSNHMDFSSDDCSVDQSFEGDYFINKKRDDLISSIKPVPHLFTDYYRWLLYKSQTPSNVIIGERIVVPIDECSISGSISKFENSDTVEVSMYSHGSDSP